MTPYSNQTRKVSAVALGILYLISEPTSALAAVGKGEGFGAWVHGFNFGSGALILNPVIILIQWINFLVLLLILNKILFKPLWRQINERNNRIESNLTSAERDRSEALGYISQYEDSLAEIQRENTEALVRLQQEMVEANRQRIDEIRKRTAEEMNDARASIFKQATEASAELESQAKSFAAQIANRLAGRQIA